MGFRPLAWNSETSLPSSGLIYTYVYLLYSTCVSFQVRVPFLLRDISVSEIVFYLHIWFAVYIGQSLSVPNLPACFYPQVGSYWDWPLHVFGGGGKSFSPPHRVLSGLFGFVWPRFRSSFEIWFTKENKRGEKTTFDSPFFLGVCIFLFFSFDVSPVRTLTNNYCY